MYLLAFLFYLAAFCLSCVLATMCHSQLCLDENHCTAIGICEMDSGYCYNRIFYVPHGPGGGVMVRGVESGCSTEFTSIMRGRCAGDPLDEEYTCACSTDMCNDYFLDGRLDRWPDDTFPLRRIQCAEDDDLKCNLHHHNDQTPCKIEARSYCMLIKESLAPAMPIRRHARVGYWPLIEYVYLSPREVACIQGMAMNHIIECYCKYENCNDLREDRSGQLVKIDPYYPLIKCYSERRFYGSDDVFRLSFWNRSLESILTSPVAEHTCLGHSCYGTYERELNVSRPWIRMKRGCMNFSRPWAFFDYVMDAEYGPRHRGMRICREPMCNDVPLYRLLDEQFRFSGSSRKCFELWIYIVILICMMFFVKI